MSILTWSASQAANVDSTHVVARADGGFVLGSVISGAHRTHYFDASSASVAAYAISVADGPYGSFDASFEGLGNGMQVTSWVTLYPRTPGFAYVIVTNANGDRLSTDIEVGYAAYGHSVAVGQNDFAVVYARSSYAGFGSTLDYNIFLKRVEADGTTGPEIPISQMNGGDQGATGTIALPDGRFLVTWESDAAIRARLLDASFGPVGDEFEISPAGSSVDLARLSDGRVIIAYTRPDEGAPAARDVAARFYDPESGTVSSEFVIASGSEDQVAVQVTALQDGGFAAAFQQLNGGQHDVFVREFDAAGVWTSGSFQVPDTGSESIGDLETLADGRVVLSWSEPNAGGVRVQVLDARDGSVQGTQGSDILMGNDALADTIGGYGGDDRIDAFGGNDRIDAGSGNDVVGADDGDDWVDGRAGSDRIMAGAGNDRVHGGADDDVLSGGAGRDRIAADAGNDAIRGGAGADVLSGGDGADIQMGGLGDDRILGGDGTDLLMGNLGADRLAGGDDADTFAFSARGESRVGISGRDIIRDFDRPEGDVIDLRRIDAALRGSGNQAFDFIGTDGFSGEPNDLHHRGELRYSVVNGSAIVLGDVNGDGSADFAIQLAQTPSLVASDFLL